jgi:catechol 2,3-dioxygenase-like lactoylglutathione lyase family enzyme
MFDHISIGVRDIAATQRFYDAVLKPLGFSRLSSGETSLGYGKEAVGLWIYATQHPVPADTRSGLHVCFAAPSPKAVNAFYAAAMEAGGKDNGKAGPRPDYGPTYYAAFVVDPDGYRLEAYTGAAS